MVAGALGVKRVVVDNDVAVATLAEHRLGAGRGFDDLLWCSPGSGVGGALILGGQLRMGAHGAAGEIGHMVVVDGGELAPAAAGAAWRPTPAGSPLNGRAGAAAATGPPHRAPRPIQERLGRPRMSSGVGRRPWTPGDPLAHELIDRAVEALGAAIASALNLVDVQAVLVGGGLGDKLGEPFVRRIETAMVPTCSSPLPAGRPLGELGDYAGAMGAALLVSEDQAGARR